MKKLIITIHLFLIQIILSQNSIEVNITGECNGSSETYEFTEVFNGKNQYLASIFFPTPNIYLDLKVGFDGTKWVLYADDITDFGYLNTNVPNGLLPPFTGWINAECSSGTMTITQNTASLENLNNSFNVHIFPNPSNANITINFSNMQEIESVQIYSLLGSKVLTTSTRIINISNLEKGVYYIEIKIKNGFNFFKQFIKI